MNVLSIKAQIDVETPIQIMSSIIELKVCDDKSHVYIHLDIEESSSSISEYFSQIDHFNLQASGKGNKTYQVFKQKNGFELEIYNIDSSKDLMSFNIQAINAKGQSLFSTQIKQSEKQKGIIDVSDHMDQHLGAFQASSLTMSQYFCGQWISQIELIAFFQDYLGLTTQEMCKLLHTYNLFSTQVTQNQIEYIGRYDLCEELENFLTTVMNDDDDDDTGNDACACNLIRTNRSALNVGSSNAYLNPSDQCNDYTPRLFARNYELNSDEDDCIMSSGRLGAAKGATFYMQYNNGADSPDFHYEMHNGWSEVSFRSICVDPVTISPDLTNCKSCVKSIDLQYGYFTRANLWGDKKFHVNGSGLGMRAEDWALLAIQDGVNFETIDRAGRSYIIDCEAPEASVSDLLTAAGDLIDPIGNVFDSLSVSTTIEAATEVAEFIETYVTSQVCNEAFVGDTTMLRGTYTFDLGPGEYFKAALISGATFGGKCENNGRGYVSLLSDFYLASAVNTKADTTGTIPEYCECEKIAAYTLGSLQNYDPLPINIRDDNPILDMNTIFDDVPYGELSMRQLAGAYIGSFGPWEPKWDQTGCCSDVQLECQSECAYISGCDNIPPLGLLREENEELKDMHNYQTHLELATRSINTHNENYKIFPNPCSDDLIIEYFGKGYTSKINFDVQLIDIHGVVHQSHRVSEGKTSLKVENLPSGVFLVKLTNDKGVTTIKRLIKN